jgi:hypothetical protein
MDDFYKKYSARKARASRAKKFQRHKWTGREIRVAAILVVVVAVLIGGAALLSGSGGTGSDAEWRKNCQYLREKGFGGGWGCKELEEREFEEGWERAEAQARSKRR